MYSNFYSNVCMFLGSLKRGVVQRHPCVTFPISKVGLDLARILHNLGVVASYQTFQNTHRIQKNHYKRWLPSQGEPATTAETQRVPHMYLRLNINYDKFHPKHVPDGASPADFNRSFFSALPEEVKLMSSTRRQRVASWKEIVAERQNHAPGIFLVSSDAGLITDVEAEQRRKGGIVLGFLGLPLSSVLQIRGMLGVKLREEVAQGARRQPLQAWSLSAAVQNELLRKEQPGAIAGGGPGEAAEGRVVEEGEFLSLVKGGERQTWIRAGDDLKEHVQKILGRGQRARGVKPLFKGVGVMAQLKDGKEVLVRGKGESWTQVYELVNLDGEFDRIRRAQIKDMESMRKHGEKLQQQVMAWRRLESLQAEFPSLSDITEPGEAEALGAGGFEGGGYYEGEGGGDSRRGRGFDSFRGSSRGDEGYRERQGSGRGRGGRRTGGRRRDDGDRDYQE